MMESLLKILVRVIERLGWLYFHIAYRPQVVFTDLSVPSTRLSAPSILIANHTSTNDPILLLALFFHKRSIVVAKDWYEMPKFHWILKRSNVIPCDRYNLDTEWALLAKRQLEAGNSVIIFPEGKCREDGLLNEFKTGFAFLARSTGAPVVSIGLDGIYKWGHRTRVVVGDAEKIERVKGLPSAKHLSERSEYFRQKVWALKCRALNRPPVELPVAKDTPVEGGAI